MAWPISLIYGVVVRVRNLLYDVRILKSKSFAIPTLCVGNLSVGGTGKTPMVEFLISKLQGSYTLAVLSRGYRRKSQGFQLGDGDATVEQLGDEPFQMHVKYPQVAVAVDGDRQNGIANLQKLVNPDLIVLDDAFQHRRVTPSFSILLTTYSQPYFSDWYLPTGSLRDSKYASKRADVIVVTKCPAQLKKDEKEVFEKRIRKKGHQKVLFSTLVYDEALYGSGILRLSEIRDQKFTLVTGIADPTPLINYLEGKQLVFEHLKFGDHHSFSPSEIALLKGKDRVVTTEKDYVRLQGKMDNLYCIRVKHRFLGDGEERLLEAIGAKIRPHH